MSTEVDDEFIDDLIANAKAQVAARKRPGRYYDALMHAKQDVPTVKAARLLATARLLIADQDAEITRLRAQLAGAWDEGYEAALRNERTIIEKDWIRNPYRIDGTNRSTPAS